MKSKFIIAAVLSAVLFTGCTTTPGQVFSQIPASAWNKLAKGAVATAGTFALANNPKYVEAVAALSAALGTTIVITDTTTKADFDKKVAALLAQHGVSTADIAGILQGLNQAYDFYVENLKAPLAGSIKPSWADLITAIQEGIQSAVDAMETAQSATAEATT